MLPSDALAVSTADAGTRGGTQFDDPHECPRIVSDLIRSGGYRFSFPRPNFFWFTGQNIPPRRAPLKYWAETVPPARAPLPPPLYPPLLIRAGRRRRKLCSLLLLALVLLILLAAILTPAALALFVSFSRFRAVKWILTPPRSLPERQRQSNGSFHFCWQADSFKHSSSIHPAPNVKAGEFYHCSNQ